MELHEQRCADCRLERPPVRQQQHFHRLEITHRQHPRRPGVQHEHDGQHQLIGRQAQHKGQQDCPV